MIGEWIPEVKEFLQQIAKREGYDPDKDGNLYEVLTECGKTVWRGDKEDYRWWYEESVVVKLDGKYVLYPDAHSTRDMSASESGWEFDRGAVQFVEPVEVTVTEYRPIPRK